MPTGGYIKLYRSILEWEWFTVPNTRDVFIYLLLIANHEQKTWKGMVIERGQAVTSYQKIAQALTMTPDEVRTAIKHLKHTGEITYETTSQFGIVTIKNYCDYQDIPTQNPTPDSTQIPPKSQAAPAQSPTQIPTNKNIRNKEERNEEVYPPLPPRGAGVASFEKFWEAYPKKAGKGAARKSWERLNPNTALVSCILSAVEKCKKTEQWQRDSGKFIPYPATWLNQERWEDEPEPQKARNTSYDIDELEELCHFDLPEDL